jgi:peptidoglycan/LPS O-acetylase OafA/YrhL
MLYKIHEKSFTKLTIIILISAFLINLLNAEFRYFWFLTLIYFLFILVSLHRLNWISNKFLIYLGSISYPLYLIHQNLGYIILNYSFVKNIHAIYSFLLALIISIIVSSILTYLIEKPIIKALKKIYKTNNEKINFFLYKSKFTKFLVVNKNAKK